MRLHGITDLIPQGHNAAMPQGPYCTLISPDIPMPSDDPLPAAP